MTIHDLVRNPFIGLQLATVIAGLVVLTSSAPSVTATPEETSLWPGDARGDGVDALGGDILHLTWHSNGTFLCTLTVKWSPEEHWVSTESIYALNGTRDDVNLSAPHTGEYELLFTNVGDDLATVTWDFYVEPAYRIEEGPSPPVVTVTAIVAASALVLALAYWMNGKKQ